MRGRTLHAAQAAVTGVADQNSVSPPNFGRWDPGDTARDQPEEAGERGPRRRPIFLRMLHASFQRCGRIGPVPLHQRCRRFQLPIERRF